MVKETYSFDQKMDIRNTQGSDVIGIYKIDIDDSTNGNLKKDHVKYLPAAKTGEKKNGNEKVETVPCFKLFQFADKLDKFLLAVGSLASFISGLGFPASVWLFGELATHFIYFTILQDSITEGDNSTSSLPFDPTDYYDLYDTGRRFALYFVSIGVAIIVSGFIQYSCFDITRERQMRTIQTRFFKSVIHQDIAWFDVHPVGELGSTFSVSMQVVSTAMGKDAPVFITWFATWCGAYGIALWKGWKVALACMAFSPLIVLLGTILGKRMKTMAIQEGKMYAKAGAIAEEVMSSIRTVMAFNGQEKESHRYDSKLKEGSISTYSKGLTMGFGIGAMWFILYCVFSTAFAFGIKLMRDGEPGLEPGNVLTIFICVMMGSMSLGKTFPTLETFSNGLAAAAKIFKIIDQKPKIDSSSDKGEKPDKINGRLELRNVSFTYPARPEVQVLKNFSITVEPGETVALVGHSGCGKSTVVQLIERFYDADSGEVLIDGKNVKDLNVSWHRSQIGLVSQEPILFSTTIKENIQHGNEDITDEEITEAAKKANIHDFISTLPDGYNTLVGDRGAQLSGGQKQRVAIARALVRNPKLLLLDEATSALDNESEAVVQKALEKAQEGRTTIIIAHRLSTIKNADKIIALEDGRVVDQGTHTELMMKDGLYHKLVEHQMHPDAEDEVVEELEHDIFDAIETEQEEKTAATLTHMPVRDRWDSKMSWRAEENEKKKEKEEEIMLTFSMKRLLKMNAPEWPLICIGALFSTIVGAM